MGFSEYTGKTTDEVLKELGTNIGGLTEKEAVLRQKKFGLNEIKEKRFSFVDIFIRQFKSPFFYLLFIAGLIAMFIGERIDSIVIIAFVLINVLIGFYQEFKAEKSILLLKKFIPHRARVVRNQEKKYIDKINLVKGDIILLEAGDIIPADARVLEANDLWVNESILTGETLSCLKTQDSIKKEIYEMFEAQNIVFAGTAIVSGKCSAVVIDIGENSAFGKISSKVLAAQRSQSSYEKNLLYFCQLILKIVLITILIIFFLNFLIKGTNNILDFSLFTVALIVSILPEALPAVVTFSLSSGSLKMAKEKVVVKRLSAVEDLGNIEILCTDKTGTLTQNKLSLEEVVSLDRKKALSFALLSSSINKKIPFKLAKELDGENNISPFDLAFLERCNNEVFQEINKFKIISILPFDPDKRGSGALVENKNKERFLIIKGSPESIIKSCLKFTNFDKKEIKEDMEREGIEGKRVLALAYRKIEKSKNNDEKSHQIKLFSEKETAERGMTFLGYFVFQDPLKSTAEESIKLAKKLGVLVKIITGDSKEVAGFVAKKIGLISQASNVVSGYELEKMFKEDFKNACEENVVFARISPDLKYKIIKCLQKKYDVAFMGDGINDAPALKTANIGIAVLGAADIAKEASDIVLLEKDLRVVMDGIKSGRTIFANINKYIKCALANNFGQFYSIAVISLFVNFLPMLPVQILLSNILSDFPLISASTDSVDIEELRKPKSYQLHFVLPLIISLGLVGTVFDFIFFAIFYKHQPATIQTLWFIEGLLTDIVLIFIIRTRHLFWKAKKPSNWLIFFTALSGIVIMTLPFLKFGQEVFHFVSPNIFSVLTVLILVVFYFAASEVIKLVFFQFFKPREN